LGPAALDDNHVLIGKSDIPAYAREHGMEKSLPALRKSITASTYKQHFGDDRTEVRNGQKLLITYAEARSILQVRVKGTIPTI
jgi:hypothetical protein